MAREFANGDMDDLGGLDAAELEHALSQGQEMDAAPLPSFKRLPQHRRADCRRGDGAGDPPAAVDAMPPRQAMRVPPPRMRVPEPDRMPAPRRVPEPMHLTEAMQLDAAMPPAHRRRRPWRAAALLLLGAALGAAAALALADAPRDGGYVVVTKDLAVLPPIALAAPPPQIIYVDKWQIVAPEPRLLQPYEVLPPAMPVAPPPQIVMIERAAATPPAAAPRPRGGPEPKALQALPQPRPEAKARAPETRPPQQDVAQELERWLFGAPDRR